MVNQAYRVSTDGAGFLDEVRSVPGGEYVDLCVQCGMCAASCPSVSWMDHSPRKIIALVRAGMREDVLNSNSMGFCASCYLCTVRCPRGVQVTDLMHVLEGLSVRHGVRNGHTATPAMHRAFVESLQSDGRIHEFGFMRRFYLRTNPLAALKMIPLGLKLLSHGRLHLRGGKAQGADQVRAIVEKAKALGGAR
jgi:heterodisulfide reductase subunit C